MPLSDLIPILQIAIGPVILISGVGLLLLSMTNRFGRVIDRSRELTRALRAPTATAEERARALAQIEILSTRARLTREAITLAILSVLSAAVLIMTLFVSAILKWEMGYVVVSLFACCMVTLIGSLVSFLRDINLSLAALKLELKSVGR
ncbi:MAG TPA: DUF2721 domain-containing protein [Terriglobia bacterium]|nr:DUF2721 domain-containing protein [Terriglobia bacterium]